MFALSRECVLKSEELEMIVRKEVCWNLVSSFAQIGFRTLYMFARRSLRCARLPSLGLLALTLSIVVYVWG